MSTSSTASASTAQALPLPGYLDGKSYDDKKDRPAISALHIYATGRLSLQPCQLCVADDKDCIVSPTKSSRCAWCSFKSMKIRECLAEGVKHNNNAPIPTSQNPNSATPTLSIRQPPPATAAVPKPTMSPPATENAGNSDSAATAAVSKPTMSPPPTENAGNSASAANANSNASMSTNNSSSSNANHDTATQQKRKRSVSDPADTGADAIAPKRTTPTATSHVSAPGSARATMDSLAGTIRLAPNGAVKYDLTIRDNDPVAWAQFAKDLLEETSNLRHVQDLGPYTMCIIRMMDEDGLWPKD